MLGVGVFGSFDFWVVQHGFVFVSFGRDGLVNWVCCFCWVWLVWLMVRLLIS